MRMVRTRLRFDRLPSRIPLRCSGSVRGIANFRNGGGTTTQCTTQLGARSAACDPAFTGSQQLSVLNQIRSTSGINVLTSANQLNHIQQGLAGGLAQTIIQNGLSFTTGGTLIIPFQHDPNIFITEILQNAARFNYNALQAEVRRRSKNGFSFQANYTFQKTLTDLPFEDQNRQGFDLDQVLPAGFSLTSVRTANPVGTAPLSGQVFFFNNTFGARATGNLPRNFINGTEDGLEPEDHPVRCKVRLLVFDCTLHRKAPGRNSGGLLFSGVSRFDV